MPCLFSVPTGLLAGARQLCACYDTEIMFLRPAEPEDALAVARVHVRSWQAAYKGLFPDDYLDQLRPEDRASKYDFASLDPMKPRTLVAVEDGLIQGFATTRLVPAETVTPSLKSNFTHFGELCALYVDPERWGCGMGVALVAAARAHLFSLGMQDAFLWILVGNLRAERFYQRDQWISDGLRRTDTIWGITVEELRYLRRLA